MLKSCYSPQGIEAGCDEAGRGCLAGPVYAAAVILPSDYDHVWLNDSKKLTQRKREFMRYEIEKNALSWAVAFAGNDEIDELNILRASVLAMHRALDKLTVKTDRILVDGNRFFSYKTIAHICLIKGDTIYKSIAAASILAKVYRDEHMQQLHLLNSNYSWHRNKGYPTEEHRRAIERYGITQYHRKSFLLRKRQLSLPFNLNK
ncbi:MAG: ribonuclease HII [Bacteroidales bacterium]|nr:ribonuclease HII [Bacteroidales bacterium]